MTAAGSGTLQEVTDRKRDGVFGECHGHMALDGVDYAAAKERHAGGADRAWVNSVLASYRDAGVTFFRDGGDAWGVSAYAKTVAADYGIDYRSPLFAIHKRGTYGGIVGRGFDTPREFAALVAEAAAGGADFIKIMTTGIMDFDTYGRIVYGEGLEPALVREMVHIAHEEGFAVMAHVNGARAVLDAVEAGVDSVEHGNYLGAECIAALAESPCCLVPTATVARNQIGAGRFDDTVLTRIWEQSQQTIRAAFDAGVTIALGSDAGAVGVPHPAGIADEYSCFAHVIADKQVLESRLQAGEAFIRETFQRH